MKSNLFCTLALGVFLVCVVYTLWLSAVYYSSVRKLQDLQYQYMTVEQTQAALNSLLNEAVEYSKKRPAIEPILQKFMKPNPGATNTASQVAPKPAAK